MKCSTSALQGSFFVLILLVVVLVPTNSVLHSQANTSNRLSLGSNEEQAVLQRFSFFPLGISGVRNSAEIWDAWKQRFNTVLFGFIEPEDFTELDIEDMLLTCDVLGINVIFELSYFLQRNDLLGLEAQIRRVAGHPSIYAWCIWNEAGVKANETHSNLAALLKIAGETVNGVDNRPTLAQFSQNATNETLLRVLPEYVDILSVVSFSNMPHVNHSIISDRVDSLMEYNAGRAKIGVVLTAQDSSQSPSEQGFDIPAEPEYMMDAVLALQRGIEGLQWFTYGQINSQSYGVRFFPDSWNALGRVIRRISRVTPILMGRENEMHVFSMGDKLDVSYAQRGNQTVLFLVNHNYNWNGTATEWVLRNHTISLEVPDIVSVSIIEPSGPKNIAYTLVGTTLSFNVTVNGGLLLLLVTSGLISFFEFSNPVGYFLISLMLLVLFYRIKEFKRSYVLLSPSLCHFGSGRVRHHSSGVKSSRAS